MAELSLRLTDGSVLVLPASLDAITTYVVLEQEAWFEKEPVFLRHWLKPGMTRSISAPISASMRYRWRA